MLIRAIRTVPLYHFQSASHSRPFMENLQIDCCRHIEKDGHYMVDLLCRWNTYLTNYDWR